MSKKSSGYAVRSLIALAVASAFPLHAAMAAEAEAAAIGQPAADAPDTATKGQLETVIVTAQRRAENIKDVPMSIATLKGDKLDVLTSAGADIRFLAGRSPSVNVESDFGRTFPRFYIRGLGNIDFDLNASQPVGLVMDDVVMENSMLKGFPVFDVDQIEVLRGPQGTLFGRNSPAGVIKLDSAKPVFKTEGYVNLGYGKDGMKSAEGAYNLPVSDTMALRFSGQTQRRDNFVHNPLPTGTQDFEGYKDSAARVQLLVKPNRDMSALLNFHVRDLDGTGTLFRANIIKPGTNELVDNFDYNSYPTDGFNNQHLKTKGSSVRLRWDLPGLTLHSITGFESLELYSRADVDGGYGASYHLPSGPVKPIPFSLETADFIPHHKQLTQEFRVESNTKDALQWIAGVFYFKEHVQIDSIGFDTFANHAQYTGYTTQSQDADSWAAFGTLNYAVSDKLKVRGGVRYTNDKKDFVATRVEPGSIGPQTIHNTSNNVSWDLSGTYTLDKDTNLFSRIATGYRAPSIQGRLYGPTDVPSMADSEKAVSIEAGIKQDLFDRRARLSASVYDYRVKNKQLTAGSGAINMNRQINADKAVGHGVELEFQANLADGLAASLGSSYNYTEIQDPNLYVKVCGSPCTVTNAAGPFTGTAWINGNPLPRAPKWQHNFTLKYSKPVGDGELYAFTDWTYRTSYNDFLYAAKEYAVKPLTQGGLRVGYKWDRYEVALYGRNITNQVEAQAAIDINNLTGIVNEPRTYGVTFKATF